MVTRAQHLTAAESDFVHSQHCHEPQLCFVQHDRYTIASILPQDLLDHTLRTVSRLCLQGLPGAHRAI